MPSGLQRPWLEYYIARPVHVETSGAGDAWRDVSQGKREKRAAALFRLKIDFDVANITQQRPQRGYYTNKLYLSSIFSGLLIELVSF